MTTSKKIKAINPSFNYSQTNITAVKAELSIPMHKEKSPATNIDKDGEVGYIPITRPELKV